MMSRFRKMNSRVWCLLLLNFCGAVAGAQDNFYYRAPIAATDSTGFYRINLQPELVARCTAGLPDMRIAGSDGRFIPYVTEADLPRRQGRFREFPLVSSNAAGDSVSVWIVHNQSETPVGAIWLKLKSAAVFRYADLDGSDDLKTWYAIRENIALREAADTDAGNFMQSLSFPASTYRYFKIRVNNRTKSPLNILQAGMYTDGFSPAEYIPVPPPSVTRKDSGRVTQVTLKFKNRYQIDKLHIETSGAPFFRRQVQIYVWEGNSRRLHNHAELSSDNNGDLVVSAKTGRIDLEIQNDDNPVLSMKQVGAFQKNTFVIAWFEAGKDYHLVFGNDKAAAPVYDLKFFTGKLDESPPVLEHGMPEKNPGHKENIRQPANTQWWLWLAVSLTGALLLGLSWKMLSEIKKKEKV